MLPGATVWLTGCTVIVGATTCDVADPTMRVEIADVLAP